jgi:hypothetical protein
MLAGALKREDLLSDGLREIHERELCPADVDLLAADGKSADPQPAPVDRNHGSGL